MVYYYSYGTAVSQSLQNSEYWTLNCVLDNTVDIFLYVNLIV